MIEYKYIGFVINKTNYKDNDAIFNILTKEGKKTFKATGILKATSKNSSSCNYFMISEFLCHSKTENSNKSLKTASIVKMYKKPYEDLLVSSSFLFICNMLDYVNTQINGYDFAIKCFDMLENGIYPLNVINYFLKTLCNDLGYQSNLNGCIHCGNKSHLISFDMEEGGFICQNCFIENRYEKYPNNYLKNLYDFLKEDKITLFDEYTSLRILNLYYNFFKDYLSFNTKPFDFVFKCI